MNVRLRVAVALAVLAGYPACQREHPPLRERDAQAATAGSANSGNTPAAVAPTATPAAPATPPAPARMETAIEALQLGNVRVDGTPACAPAGADADEGQPADQRWLRAKAVQRDVYAFDAALTPFSSELLGTGIDHAAREMVVVFQTTFRAFPAVAAKLAEHIHTLHVRIAPACFDRAAFAAAEQTLTTRDFHPRASRVAMGFHLDARLSRFEVTLPEAESELADALRARLGPIAHVRFGLPARH